MSYECWCDYDPPQFYRQRAVKAARREHKCEECGCKIKPGEPYEYTTGQWDGTLDAFKTCALCRELREWAKISVPCFCWAHGNLHEDVREMVQAVAPDVPGFFMEYGRRMVRINRARAEQRR